MANLGTVGYPNGRVVAGQSLRVAMALSMPALGVFEKNMADP